MNNTNNSSPKTYLISVAVGNYEWGKLPNAVKDSNDIIEILTTKYKVETHETLHNAEATPTKLHQTFIKLKDKGLQEEDSLLFFFNGHGDIYHDSTHFLLNDAKEEKDNNWYSWQDLVTELRGLNIRHIALFINSCYSGNIFSENYKNSKEGSTVNSRIVFTSGRKNQQVADNSIHNSNNSPFTEFIIDILRSNNEKYKLSIRDIINYAIGKLLEKDFGSQPMDGRFDGDEGGEFYIELKKGDDVVWEEAKNLDRIEAYESYKQKFPEGNHIIKADNRIGELLSERKDWLLCNEAIVANLKEFIEKQTLPYPKFKTKADEILKDFGIIVKDLTEEQDAEKRWNEIRPSRQKQDFIEFVRDFGKSIYVSEAKGIITHLERKDEEEKLWDEIPKTKAPNKEAELKNRRNAYAMYLHKYKSDKYSSKASKKIKELDLWIDISKETNTNKKREKLRRYKAEFSEGDYIKEAEKELQNVSIEVYAKKLSAELNETIKSKNYDEIEKIIAHIEGMNENEKEANTKTLNLANHEIKKYQLQIEEEYKIAIEKDRVYLLFEFMTRYKEHKLSKVIEARLTKKDHELFEFAEATKTISDYKSYIDEFEMYNGIFLNDASDRIDELTFFQKLKTKEDFTRYLVKYSKGIMRKEAQIEIDKITENEEKERRFNEVMSETSIPLCTRYLHDYKEEDNNRKIVEDKLSKLINIEKEEKAFIEIQELEGIKKLNACKTYEIDFPNGVNIDAVKSLIREIEQILEDNAAFKIAEKANTIDAFEEYKRNYPQGVNWKNANDYVTFIKANDEESIPQLLDYIKEFPEGLNISKANDSIAFFEARKSNSIFNLEKYLEDFASNGLHLDKARDIIKRLRLEEEEENMFQLAKNEKNVDAYLKYLSGSYPKKSENEKYAKDKIKELGLIETDNKAFEEAEKNDDEDSYLNYLSRYGKKGIHYKAVSKKLREKQLGITEKDYNMLDKVESNTSALNDLSHSIRNSNKDITLLLKIMIFIFIIGFLSVVVFFIRNK